MVIAELYFDVSLGAHGSDTNNEDDIWPGKGDQNHPFFFDKIHSCFQHQ